MIITEVPMSSPPVSVKHELTNKKNYDDIFKENIMSFVNNNNQMRFREISETMVSLNVTHSNCLAASNYYILLLGTLQSINGFKMEIMKLENSQTPFHTQPIVLPNTIPTSKIFNEAQMESIHQNINIFDKQTLALDPFYTMHFSKAPFAPQLLSFSMTNYDFQKPLMAVITTYGACALLTYNELNRSWKECKIIINDCLDEFANIKKANQINSFKLLQNMIQKYVITVGCWQNDSINFPIYYCSNAAGDILAIEITQWKAKLLSHVESGLKEIFHMEVNKNILIVCNNEGILQSFEISNGKNIKMKSTLWNKADNITCGKILLNYCSNSDKFYVVTSKASHLLVFILNVDGTLISKQNFYVGNIEITGLETITSNIYVVATLCGFIEVFSFRYENNTLDTIRSNIKVSFDVINFHIKGMAASPNKVAWSFLLVPNKFHTGPTRNCQTITFLKTCSFNAIRPIPLLIKYPNNFGNLIDCLETIRLDIIKNTSPEIYQKFKAEPMEMNLDFINKLRLERLISKFSHVNVKYSKNDVYNINITMIIESIILYRRLKYLLSLKKRSNFISTSGTLMLLTLKIIFNHSYEQDSKTFAYREFVWPYISQLLEECEGEFSETIDEICQYCDSPIDGKTLTCSNGHKNPRCCISYKTLPLFNQSFCPNCKLSVVLDDFESLRTVLPEDEEINCSICNATVIQKVSF